MRTVFGSLLPLGAAAVFVAATGCSSLPVQTQQRTGMTPFPPTSPASVQILREPPTRPNVKLGEITAEPHSTRTPVSVVEAKFREAGAKLGANAVVIVVETKLTGARVASRWWDGQTSTDIGQVFLGVPIRYTEPGVAGRVQTP